MDCTETELIRLYQSGLTMRQIAPKLNFSLIRVSRTLKKLGIQARPKRRVSTRTCNPYFFDHIDTEEKAYWLGFILADGCVGTNCTTLRVNLTSIDIPHLQKLNKSLESDFPLYHKKDSGRYGISNLTVNNKYLANSLRSKGIIANQKTVFDVQTHLRRHFWRGVVDGDGWLQLGYNKCKTGPVPHMSIGLCGNRETILKFRVFCLDHIWSRSKIVKKPKGSNIDIFRLHGLPAYTICSLLYKNATVYLDRKMNRFKKYRKIYLDHHFFEEPI